MNTFLLAGLHGFWLSLGLILPLGAQNVFVFNQGAMQRNWLMALPAILTAALCDTILILLAVLGVSVAVLHLVWVKNILIGVGILFLLYMGWVNWRSMPKAEKTDETDSLSFSAGRQILFAASVSLFNPHAILDTIGVIGTSSLQYSGMEKAAYTAACIAVSWLWFLSLALTGHFTGKLDPSGNLMRRINQLSALIMWGAALYLGWMLAGNSV